MARKATISLSWPGYAVPLGGWFEFTLLGQTVRFNSASGTNTSTQRYFGQNYRGTGDGGSNLSAIAAAISAWLPSVGMTGATVTGTFVPRWITGTGFDLATIVVRSPIFGDFNNFSGLAVSGDFMLSTTGGTGDNSTTASVTLATYDNIDPPTITSDADIALCYASATGTIALALTGGVGPYTYLWNDGATTANRSGLVAGTYTVTVTDSAPAGPPTAGNSWMEPGIATQSVVVGQNTRLEAVLRLVGNNVYLTVTGGVAPYTYLWSDGPTTSDRTEMVPGAYTLTIRDSLGCGAVLNITIEPYHFFFSQNPITLDVDAGDAYRADPSTKPGLVFECEVYYEPVYMSDEWVQLGPTLQQPPRPDGRSTFDVAQLLETVVQPFLPELSQRAVVRADGVFRRYYLRHREVTTTGPLAFTEMEHNYVVRGGLSFQEYAAGTFSGGYQRQVKPFFTWEPTTKSVLSDQPEYLFFMPDSFTLTEFQAKIRATYTDGTTDTRTFGTVTDLNRYELWCLPVGYTQRTQDLAARAHGRTLEKWEIFVTDAAGVLLSEVRTYLLDRRYYEFKRYFLYANSLGGINTLAVVGIVERRLGVKSQISDRSLPPRYDARWGDQEVVRKVGVPGITCWSGGRSAAQLLADQDFLQAEYGWLVDENRLLAGTLKDATTIVADDDSNRPALKFDFDFSREQRYTPRLRIPVSEAELLEDIVPPEIPDES